MEQILILTDFTKKSEHAADFALRIAERSNSDLILFNAFHLPQVMPATEPLYPYYEDFSSIKKEESDKLEDFAHRLTQKAGLSETGHKPSVSHFNEPGTVGENITNILQQNKNIWLIVMGDKKIREDILSRFIFGSDTYTVINMANCPVLLIPPQTKKLAIKTIVFASNLEKTDYKALRVLAHFATFFKAKIVVTHVYSHTLSIQEKVDQYETYMRIAGKVNYPYITYEDFENKGEGISEALSKFVSKTKPDVLAMINKKHPFFERIFHISATHKMLDSHQLPIMVLPSEIH
ncbi:MAG TPA: universal stress protein [Sphingobacteriaceae bacterium]